MLLCWMPLSRVHLGLNRQFTFFTSKERSRVEFSAIVKHANLLLPTKFDDKRTCRARACPRSRRCRLRWWIPRLKVLPAVIGGWKIFIVQLWWKICLACTSDILFKLQVTDMSYRQVLTRVNTSQLLLKLESLDKLRRVTFYKTTTQRSCIVITGSYQF